MALHSLTATSLSHIACPDRAAVRSLERAGAAPSVRCTGRRAVTVAASASSSSSAAGSATFFNPLAQASAASAAAASADPFVVTSSGPATTAQRSAEGDVMGLLLRQRIVFLGAELNDFVADAIVSQLLLLDAQDSNRDIRLFVNCPGGSISAAMAIFDAINYCRAPVSTVAFGLAASTAAVVLAGGTKGRRLAMPNARIMMHQPMGGASGQAIDVEIQAKEIMYHKSNIARILSEITGRPYAQVEKDMDRDRYMSPVEAMEYGLIDAVIDRDAILPLMPSPERVKPRREYLEANDDPRKFLLPVIPDSEIF
eukprot:TRINITY_DN77850_c0_g1_i1.p1 TRINITY_DN77850_c0_g1~~TRINITY_DN77850_c0_g1_i1.p1  ORF type:complete len:312 (-),score=-8.12 TRINITY_DN77850_c0_g1_i1:253-1188(-)